MVRKVTCTLALLCCLSTAGCRWISDKLVERKAAQLCEADLFKHLPAPASYERVSTEYGQLGPYTKADMRRSSIRTIRQDEARFAQLTPLERFYLADAKNNLKSQKSEDETYELVHERAPNKAYMVLIYDAQNSFGTVLRSAYMCDLTADADHHPLGVYDAGPVDRAVAEQN